MAIYHEHPNELQSALTDFCYIKLTFKNSDSGITAAISIRLGEFIQDRAPEEAARIDLRNMIGSIHYLAAPRNYIVIRLRDHYANHFLTDSKWYHVTDKWYIFKDIPQYLPCSWKTSLESVRLLRYDITEWSCID